jgi:Dual OB-containing domain
VLDIIDVSLIGPKANPYQSENWLLNPNAYWRKVGEFGRDYLHLLTGAPVPLWPNGRHTRNGQNDYVPVEEIDKTDGSLKLIAVDNLKLHVYRPGEDFDNPRRRVQAEFPFGGMSYFLWVTDPLIETAYLAQADGVYTLRSSYLTISLGEPWDGHCYKLVAAIIGAIL